MFGGIRWVNKEIAAKWLIYMINMLLFLGKASNHVVFACKKYHIQCLIKELGMGSNGEQIRTFQATNFFKQEILSKHKSVLSSHGISSSDQDNDNPLLY